MPAPTVKPKTILDEVRKLDNRGILLHWIKAREKTRLEKQAGHSKPWTNDPILASYRFCNVRRWDDKVSQYLDLHWYTPNKDHKNIVIACVLARHFNQPLTLAKIGFPKVYNEGYIQSGLEHIESLKRQGETTFNSAYIIRADGKFPNKAEMVFYETVQQFVDSPTKYLNKADSMEDAVNLLMGYRNIGSFMAGQIAADLRWATSGKFLDKDTWAAMGPGSVRGMNWLQGRDIKFPLKQEQFLEELKEFKRFAIKALPTSITSRLEMIDWQNMFCEIFKYVKALTGIGKPKQKYDGGL